MSDWFVRLQRFVPHHALSRFTGALARSEQFWIRRPFIHGFARAYGVDLAEAERSELDAYSSFNDFFTRALKPGARPIEGRPADETLREDVKDREVLLILDNIEQVAAAAPAIAELLTTAPGLTVLATSRGPLSSEYSTRCV